MPNNRHNPHNPQNQHGQEISVAWIVYRDRFPLAAPHELGRVAAPDKPTAEAKARERWPDIGILVQSAASADVARLELTPPSGPVKAPVTTKPAHKPNSRFAKRVRRVPPKPPIRKPLANPDDPRPAA